MKFASSVKFEVQVQLKSLFATQVTKDCAGLGPAACLFGVIHTNSDGWHASWPYRINSQNCEGVDESEDDWSWTTQITTYAGQTKNGRQSPAWVGEDGRALEAEVRESVMRFWSEKFDVTLEGENIDTDGHYEGMRSTATHMACGIDVDNDWLNIDFAKKGDSTYTCGEEQGQGPSWGP